MYNKTLKRNQKAIQTDGFATKITRSKTEHISEKYRPETKPEENIAKIFAKTSNENKFNTDIQHRYQSHSPRKNISFSSKKPTVKELVYYPPEKVLKKKDFLLFKFKTILNKAKFSNSVIKTEIK